MPQVLPHTSFIVHSTHSHSTLQPFFDYKGARTLCDGNNIVKHGDGKFVHRTFDTSNLKTVLEEVLQCDVGQHPMLYFFHGSMVDKNLFEYVRAEVSLQLGSNVSFAPLLDKSVFNYCFKIDLTSFNTEENMHPVQSVFLASQTGLVAGQLTATSAGGLLDQNSQYIGRGETEIQYCGHTFKTSKRGMAMVIFRGTKCIFEAVFDTHASQENNGALFFCLANFAKADDLVICAVCDEANGCLNDTGKHAASMLGAQMINLLQNRQAYVLVGRLGMTNPIAEELSDMTNRTCTVQINA